MNEPIGYILLSRKIMYWDKYTDGNTFRLFIHLLLLANWEDKEWKGISIKRGQVITSINKLANQMQLTTQQTRTSLNKLILTNEITKYATKQYTIITIVNYEKYQNNNKQNNNQITNNATNDTTNKATTTNNIINKEYKNNTINNMSSKNAQPIADLKKEDVLNIQSITNDVIGYLNKISGRSFSSSSSATKRLISARLKEKFTADDMKDVIYYKYQEWCVKPFKFNNGKMSDEYFRPNTLFNSQNFENYLEEYKRWRK